jgi:phosphoribosylaminoimidazolecarboxamide formyltransferase/IMP cyclohydrolase
MHIKRLALIGGLLMARKKRKRWALISVYDKTGVVELARRLIKLGFSILASGGTARTLREAGIEVTDVAELTGREAILGHRVVTLSGEVHAGLLARWIDADITDMEKFGLRYIDLVVSNLYPMTEVIAQEDATEEKVTENTDIGGPCLLRSAAKGRRIIITDPSEYEKVLAWLEAGELDRDNVVRKMAATAEYINSCYTLASAGFISKGEVAGFIGRRKLVCKYGENPWQAEAALYSFGLLDPLAVDRFKLVFGTDASFNNIRDVDRLLQTLTHMVAVFLRNRNWAPYAAVACKHGNPCGAAVAKTPDEALRKMVAGDTRAIMGGLVMVNFVINRRLAEILLTHLMPSEGRRVLDGVIAPAITEDALELFKRKGDKCRVLVNPELGALDADSLDTAPRFVYVRGGFLMQPNYTYIPDINDPELECSAEIATEEQEDDLLLASAIGSTSNSNTVTLVHGGMLIGNGTGQQDRYLACMVAVLRAKEAGHKKLIKKAVAYSDSFFPFDDGPEVLTDAGIEAIFASSGSVRDVEVRDFCRRKGIAFYQLPDSKCRGFYGH